MTSATSVGERAIRWLGSRKATIVGPNGPSPVSPRSPKFNLAQLVRAQDVWTSEELIPLPWEPSLTVKQITSHVIVYDPGKADTKLKWAVPIGSEVEVPKDVAQLPQATLKK
jgi:hypothetical protein